VLVLRTLGAPERRRLRGKRPKKAEPQPDPTPVVTARVTLIDAAPLAGADAAGAWLRKADGEALADEAVRSLNRIVHLHRVSVAQPEVREVGRGQALAVRIGYGVGEEVADGRFTEALELPLPRGKGGRRTAVLRPQERLAALLSGRDVALACEELVLRARADLDGGRAREAALGLRPALEAAIAELVPWAERGDLQRRIDELATLRPEALGTYERALEGGLDEDETKRVDRILGRIEAALRARTAGGID
jgi:hypothetical protein